MLDFTNFRKITDKMKVESFAYAENFWQKIFDAIPFDEEAPINNVIIVTYPGCWGAELEIPKEADISEYFDTVKFDIRYSYSGDIDIYFKYDYDESESSPYHTILADVLLDNGFIQTDSKGLCFKRNINKD